MELGGRGTHDPNDIQWSGGPKWWGWAPGFIRSIGLGLGVTVIRGGVVYIHGLNLPDITNGDNELH